MRYYGEDYKKYIIDSLTKVQDAVDGTDYASSIRRVDVSSKNAGLKTECVNAARTAYTHVGSIRGKIGNIILCMGEFYDDTDEIADTVLESTKEINELLTETNAALVRMNAVVNGIGEYDGTKVTPETLKSAGLNETKCNELKASIWDRLFTIQSADDKISYDAAVAFVDYVNNLQMSGLKIPEVALKHADPVFGIYIDKMKSIDPHEIAAVDMKRIEGIYNYYVATRDVENFKDLDTKLLQNCVDVYEILDPDAKNKTDDLFYEVYAMNDEQVNLNILRTKYALYTSDEQHRNAMFYYMPQLVVRIPDDKICKYNPENYMCADGKERQVLYIYLLREDDLNNNFCSFFHEYGHAIDDLSALNTDDRIVYSSERFKENLITDLKEHMKKTLTDKLKIYLHDDKRNEVIDFFFTPENINVVNSKGKDFPYPNHWTASQATAYYQLRSYYGYKEYIYNPWEYYPQNGHAFKIVHNEGYATGYEPEDKPKTTGNSYIDQQMEARQNEKEKGHYGIRDDIIGGLTNNQIGGVYNGHYRVITNNPSIIRGSSFVHDRLIEFDGWYKNNSLNDDIGWEFFAENWAYGVLGYDIEPTREVFSTSRSEYEKIRDKIFEDTSPK